MYFSGGIGVFSVPKGNRNNVIYRYYIGKMIVNRTYKQKLHFFMSFHLTPSCLKDIVCMVRNTWMEVERHNGVSHTFN